MKKTKWFALMCVVALVGVAGCSSDDDDPLVPDIPDVGGAAAAEAAINGALNDVVDPLFLLLDLVETALAVPAPASRGVGCPPDLSGVCNVSGMVTCTEGITGLEFTFTGCMADVDGDMITVDGLITALPGLGTLTMTFDNVSVNGSTGLSGLVTLDEAACSALVDVLADDGTVLDGFIIDCDDNDPDDLSEFTIIVTVANVGVYVIVFDFDNTGIASALVSLDAVPVASCSVDLNALDADCVDL